MLHADADRGDLVFGAFAFVGTPHPNPDAVFAALAMDIECGERVDDPFLDGGDETAHIRRAPLQIEHHVADALAGAVIGELAAAAGAVDRKTRLDQLLRPGGRAGRVKGRVLQQPNQLARLAARNRRRARRHRGKRVVVVDQAVAHAPFDRRRTGGGKQANCQIVARVNDPVTMPW